MSKRAGKDLLQEMNCSASIPDSHTKGRACPKQLITLQFNKLDSNPSSTAIKGFTILTTQKLGLVQSAITDAVLVLS